MSNLLKMMAGSAVAPLYADDVFQSYTRTGTGAEVTVTTNIDMTKGYTLWSKGRSGATDHAVYDSARGVTLDLVTNSTAAATAQAQGLKSVSATGHTLGTLAKINTSTATYVDWVFRFAPNFHEAQTVTKSSGSNATVSFPGLTTLGMVMVKRTDNTGSWYVWHRSLTAGKLLYLEQTAAEATLGHITVSGTTVTLVNGVIADGSYVVYAWAHDASAEGLIQCGSFTTDGSGNFNVPLGWEPQYILWKTSSTAVQGAWNIFDSARGLPVGGFEAQLSANYASSETNTSNYVDISATGFSGTGIYGSNTLIYLAIRRPNKPPTTGTQVYNGAYYPSGLATGTKSVTNFPVDMQMARYTPGASSINTAICDRLRGASSTTTSSGPYLVTSSTAAETGLFATGWDNTGFLRSGGFGAADPSVYHSFRRAPGFFDEVCDTGSGANKTEAHNLTVPPELWLRKGRSGATQWVWGSSLLANTQKIVMPSPNGVVTDATAWNSTYPTATAFSIGTAAAVNTSTATYTTYLWATLAGISKVGTYTGNGSSLTVNCGFSAGARFVMIIRTTASTAQDIFIWDTVRGIVAGNDPHLSLNTTAAEVTTDDSVDPESTGFIVNQLAATNINVTGAVYLYLAIA